jgi:hypothetical protein
MEKVRPHHVVCLTKLYKAISLFAEDKELYYECIKKELIKSTNLRLDLLDCCKFTWGNIYSNEVMDILAKIVTDGTFITTDNTCDSICSQCYGKVDGKCVGEETIQIMDSLATKILNLQYNTPTEVATVQDNNELDRVCSACRTKTKCTLIRDAVSSI